jgi:hypothetical protein
MPRHVRAIILAFLFMVIISACTSPTETIRIATGTSVVSAQAPESTHPLQAGKQYSCRFEEDVDWVLSVVEAGNSPWIKVTGLQATGANEPALLHDVWINTNRLAYCIEIVL